MGNPLSRPTQPKQSPFRPRPSTMVVTDCRAPHTHCFPPNSEQPRRFILVGTFAEFERLFDDPLKPNEDLQSLLQVKGNNAQQRPSWVSRSVRMLVGGGAAAAAENQNAGESSEEVGNKSSGFGNNINGPSAAASRVAAMLYQAVYCKPLSSSPRKTSTESGIQEKHQQDDDEMVVVYEDWNVEIPLSREVASVSQQYNNDNGVSRNLGCLFIIDHYIPHHNHPNGCVTERYDMYNGPWYRRDTQPVLPWPAYNFGSGRWSPKRLGNWRPSLSADFLYNEKNQVVLFPWCEMAPADKAEWMKAAEYLIKMGRRNGDRVGDGTNDASDDEKGEVCQQQRIEEEDRWWAMRQIFNAYD